MRRRLHVRTAVLVAVTVAFGTSGIEIARLHGQSQAITLVQHASKDAGVASSSSLAFPANSTGGNFIAVAVRTGGSGASVSVTDTRGNVYRQAVRFDMTVDTPAGDTLAIFYAENVNGGA